MDARPIYFRFGRCNALPIMEIEGRGPRSSPIERILMEKALEILEISMKYGGKPIQWDSEKHVDYQEGKA